MAEPQRDDLNPKQDRTGGFVVHSVFSEPQTSWLWKAADGAALQRIGQSQQSPERCEEPQDDRLASRGRGAPRD